MPLPSNPEDPICLLLWLSNHYDVSFKPATIEQALLKEAVLARVDAVLDPVIGTLAARGVMQEFEERSQNRGSKSN